jgi:hypothetical protein
MGKQWGPLSSTWVFSRSVSAIRDKYDGWGMAMWCGYLAACKRNSLAPGTFTYAEGAEMEAVTKLLGAPIDVGFTLDDFFALTGKLHQTKRRKEKGGRIVHVECSNWADWNRDYQREHDRERKQKQRARAGSTNGSHDSSKAAGDSEEVRRVFDHWVKARKKGDRVSLTEGRRRVIKTRLKEFTADDLCRAIDGVARDPWPERKLHDDLTKIMSNKEKVENWLAMADTAARREAPRPVEDEPAVDEQALERVRELAARIGNAA